MYDTNNDKLASNNPNTTSKYRFTYNPDGNSPNRQVWIVAHGQKNDGSSMDDVTNAIYNHTDSSGNYDHRKDIILTVGWKECTNTFITPNIDQCIRPIAEDIAKSLKQWGLTNPNNLKMVGHSMGTFMITEISKALKDNEGLTNANTLYLLDPPHYWADLAYTVDDRSGNLDSRYDINNGYKHFSPDSKIIAFTGLDKQGQDNGCGNSDLNQTAYEHVTIFIPDLGSDPITSGCAIHGEVHEVWSKLINDKTLDNKLFDIDNQNISTYTPIKVYQNNVNVNTTIYASGNTAKTTTPENTMRIENYQLKQYGKTGQVNLYSNTPNNSALATNQQQINLQGFEEGDKIVLHKQNTDYSNSTYNVTGAASNPKIQRTVECLSNLCFLSGGGRPLHISVDVGGSGVTPQSYLDAQSSDPDKVSKSSIQLRNN